MAEKKRICWVTATYFLDVDLPIVPRLTEYFDIDWYVVSTSKAAESDAAYIRTQASDCKFSILSDDTPFYSKAHYNFCKNLILKLKNGIYDWYYFDISDFLYLFPLIHKHLPADRITIATHNVSVPKGARLAPLAKISMRYILLHFRNFQVFSKNQLEVLKSKNAKADVFYCPLMLKDYGGRGNHVESDVTRFLFFGNIIRYKRLDVLLEAVRILEERGVKNFKVDVCGYCRPSDWDSVYAPMIKSDKINTDIRRIPNELVPQLFANADYFVMPYQDIAQSGAMTVAFNYNIPIIASRLDTFREFLSDNEDGFFFNPGDADSLADILVKAIQLTKSEYNRLRTNQQSMIDRLLSTKAITQRYKEYLNSHIDACISK